MRCSGSLPPEQSITNRRFEIPTCTAARPTPGAAYIVSNMFETSFFRLSSKNVTGSAGISSIGFGHLTTSNNAIVCSATAGCIVYLSRLRCQFYDEVCFGASVGREILHWLRRVFQERSLSTHATVRDSLRSCVSSRRDCRRQTFRASQQRGPVRPSPRQSHQRRARR